MSELGNYMVGQAFPSSEFSKEEGVRLLRGDNVKTGFIQWGEKEFLWPKGSEGLEKYLLESGDIVIGMDGSRLGRNWSLVSEKDLPALLVQRVARIRPHDEVCREMICSAIDSHFFRWYIHSVSTGSAIPHVSHSGLANFPVPYPNENIRMKLSSLSISTRGLSDTQKAISKISSEYMAAIFRSWFIDFDPVKAKAEGKLPYGMDEETAALFPDSLEDSELGPIPTGWRIDRIDGLIKRLKVGKKYDQWSVQEKGNIPVLDQGKKGIIGYHNETPGVTASLHSPVVIFCNHTCLMKLVTHPFSAIQNVLPFVGQGVDTTWAYFATRDKQEFTGYKGHWPDFIIHKLVVPPEELTKKFGQTVSNLIALIEQKNIIAGSSESVRDFLLPRLMSGELELPVEA